jgi:hypothetical protein
MGGRVGAPQLLLFAMVVSCNASVQLVLKPPIEEKCKDAGLHGCDEMTEGVLLLISLRRPRRSEGVSE